MTIEFVETYANAFGTTIGVGGITSGATSVPLTSIVGIPRAVSTDNPPTGFRAIIDGDSPSANTEIVWVTDASTSPVTVIRAAETFPGGCAAGSPVAHAAGVPFRAIATAKSMQKGIGRSPQGFGPGAYKLLSWNFDPAPKVGAGTTLTIGEAYFEAIPISEPVAITDIVLLRAVAGASLLHCFAGIFDKTGVQLGITADLSTAWAAAVGPTTYDERYALVSGPISYTPDSSDEWLFVGLLVGAGSTTSPTFGNAGGYAAAPNPSNLSTGPYRSGYNGVGGATALPSPLVPANIDTTNNQIWVALD